MVHLWPTLNCTETIGSFDYTLNSNMYKNQIQIQSNQQKKPDEFS